MRIALLEDDEDLAQLMMMWLENASHICQHYATCKPFLRIMRRETFDLLIIDWELPDGTGLDVLKQVRTLIDWPVPVLFATNRTREDDIVQALRAGADDYMVKPVKEHEMLARIQALERRAFPSQTSDQPLQIPPYYIDPHAKSIKKDDREVILTDKEFDLAYFLFRNLDRLLSRAHLLDSLWGLNTDVTTRTLDTHISNIRKKLNIKADTGFRIKTIYRHGYRLEKIDPDPG